MNQSRDFAERALKINKRLLGPSITMIHIERGFGRREQARKVYDSIIEHCPTCLTPRVAFMKALWPRWGGSLEEMQKFAQESVAKQKDNPRLKVLQGFLHAELAHLLKTKRDYSGAISELEQALSYGIHEEFLTRLADAYDRSDRLSEAIATYTRALERVPEDIELVVSLSKVLAQGRQLQKATEMYFRALGLDSTAASLVEWKKKLVKHITASGYQSYQEGKLEEANSLFSLGLRIDSEDGQLYYYRGMVFMKRRDGESAQREFEQAIKYAPADFESCRQLDWLYVQKGNFAGTVAMWSTFIKNNPKHAGAYLERGGTYFRMGDQVKAKSDAKLACDLGNEEGCKRFQQLGG